MNLRPLLTLILVLALPVALSAKKESDKEEKTPRNPIVVKLTDGTTLAGELTAGWYRFPSKTINENFKMRPPGGEEIEITSEQVASIIFPDTGTRFTAADIPVPSLRNKNNVEHWIVECGPKSEHAEILSYKTRALVTYGTFQRWEDCATRCVRFGDEKEIYPFEYDRNGGFNLNVMKKMLNDRHPGLIDYMKRYFKENKKLKKELNEHPEHFLEAYEKFLTEQK